MTDLIQRFKNWLIEKLGGITKLKHSDAISACESFANEHLVAKNGETLTTGQAANNIYTEGDIVVIGSNACVSNFKCHEVQIAPWCKFVIFQGGQCD